MNRFARAALVAAECAVFVARAGAQEAVGDSVVVTATRQPDAAASSPFAVNVVDEEELRRAPQLRLDDILRAQVPGFSLFRRSSSRAANPTTQGVTLRNFGPSGAGRTLVLVDGIPLNDPFAGYVLWNQVPPAALESVVVTPGGGAGLFGNAALAGTIFLRTRAADASSASIEAVVGNRETDGANAFASFVDRGGSISIFAERFSTGGYPVLRDDQRGPVDTDASAKSELLQVASDFSLGANTSLRVQLRGFREERDNGTVYTRNETQGADASAVLIQKLRERGAELRVTAYAQDRKFRSTFSSVNATRTVETPALDQHHVPASAFGGSVVAAVALADEHSLALGADVRAVEGETNERFRFLSGGFTRERTAGGEQFFIGVFAEDRWKVADAARLTAGVRLDRWQLTNGSRVERDRGSGAVTLRSEFADRDGYNLNGRLGGTADLNRNIAIRAAGYTGFRVPTLNELYRPFRVGNAVTEANADLDPERLIGGEAALEWRPTKAARIAGTLFYNRLEDAIGNVTIGFGPGNFDPGGFIPEGGVLRQRRNIELVTALGVEFAAEWQLSAQVFVRASYLYTRPTIERSSERALVGKLLAQTPEHVTTTALEWKPDARWLLAAQARYSGRQFEDDQNALPLPAYFTLDAAAFYDLSSRLSAGLKIENIFDTEIESGKTPDGLVSIGAPRLLTFQLQYRL